MLNSRGFGEYVLEEQLSLNQYDLEGFPFNKTETIAVFLEKINNLGGEYKKEFVPNFFY
jgi:hypothetical protein